MTEEPERTVTRTIGLTGVVGGGAPGVADVKDGKIIRVRPLHYDWNYDKKELNPWKFNRIPDFMKFLGYMVTG